MRKRTVHQDCLAAAGCLLMCIGLFFIPSARRQAAQTGTPVKAVVISTDDSDLQIHGLLEFGSQHLRVRLAEGKFAGEEFDACNEIRSQMELDKHYHAGDVILVAIQEHDLPGEAVLTALDYHRNGWFLGLGIAFCLLLCGFGGWVGVKALFSFAFSCMIIWKAVIPLALQGIPASWTIFGVVCILTAAIQYLVAGFNRKGTTAFIGAISGVLAGLALAHLFAAVMRINGAVMPYAQALYYAGYDFLNLQDLFVGAMILASSGAVMDLAMDIASGVEEVVRHNPGLTTRQLFASGCRIGRSVVGTMTTTLLLAYSGGYITLLMMFYSQGTPLTGILNNPLVAAEAVKTLIGSFSLILVAPFTAFFASLLLGSPSRK